VSAKPEAAGAFRQHPLPKLLFYLYRRQFTGLMTIQADEAENTIYFRDGMPVSAQVADMVEPVGRILLELGYINDELYNMSLVQAAETGQRQGEVLQSIGAVGPDQVEQAFKLQVLRKLLRLFKLREAQFALYREDHELARTPEEAARMRVHPRRIIYHGIRNAYDLERLREEVGRALENVAFRLDSRKAPNLDRYQFGAEDSTIIELLGKGFWDIDSLANAAGRGEVDAWMMAYTLLVTDMLEVRAGESSASSGNPGMDGPLQRMPIATPMPFQPPADAQPRPYSHPGGGTRPPGVRNPSLGASGAGQTRQSSTPPAEASRPGIRAMRPPTGRPSSMPAGRGSSNAPAVPSGGGRPGSSPAGRPDSAPPGRPGSSPPGHFGSTPSGRPGSSPPGRPSSAPPGRPGSVPPGGRPKSFPPRAAFTAQELRALTREALALKEQIEDKGKFLDQRNLFEVLGVGREASRDQIKSAYLQLARVYHPDRLAQFRLEPLRVDVEKIFARLSEAQATLMDDLRRKEYVTTLDGAAKGDAEKARKLLEAENQFQLGEVALRQRQYDQAERHFRTACELNPEEGEHHAFLAWTIYQNPTNSRAAVLDTVKQGLTRAIKLSRNNPRPYYLLGELFLAENDLERAIGSFRKALELREDYVDAERGLRLATMRKEKSGDKKSSLFDRFRKK
jgi:tetratricopeptide (TPR) repeat protein